jgi:uncharacterized membrane protein
MIGSALIGAVAGMRAMTPLATVSAATRAGELPQAPDLLAHPLVVAGSMAVAAGEIAGDKMKTAPDRIVIAGMAARVTTASIAGAAMATRDRRVAGAAVAVAAAIGAAYLTFALRVRAMRRYGQDATGMVEDMLALGGAALIVHTLAPADARH